MTVLHEPHLRAQLVAAFTAEASERLETVSRALVELEGEPTGAERDELVQGLLRESHTIKGAARAAGQDQSVTVAHALETEIGRLTDDPGEGSANAALELVDTLRDHIRRLTGQTVGPDPPPPTPEADAAPAPPPMHETEDEQPPSAPSQGTAEAAAAHAPLPMPALTPAGSVRVAADKLDLLLNDLGQLLAVTTVFQERTQRLADLDDEIRAHPGTANLRRQLAAIRREHDTSVRELVRAGEELRHHVQSMRMQPVSTLLGTLPRVVRDLSRDAGRTVRVHIVGEDVELDRNVLDAIAGPLLHLVRNAVEHGAEDEDVRRAAGKPPAMTVSVGASRTGGDITLLVSDDGRGISPDQVRAAAVDSGLLPREAAEALSDQEAVQQVLRSGLSTSATVTELSGRGVGLDVVREVVDALHGDITIRNTPGAGVIFSLRLPITIATMRCLTVRADRWFCALPVHAVAGVVTLRPETTGRRAGTGIAAVGDQILPLASLAAALDAQPAPPSRTGQAVVLDTSGTQVVLAVDEILGVEELVVDTLPWPLPRSPLVAGAATQPSGVALLVLDPDGLVEAAGSSAPVPDVPASDGVEEQTPAHRPVVLIAEDSMTTRTLEKNILEAAGYEVLTAADGSAAWEMLQCQACDLVVADVMMPGLTGLELTERVRADQRFQDLPVVMVTSLDSDAHRRRGLDAGADAYVTKSGFDQEDLLATIRRLV